MGLFSKLKEATYAKHGNYLTPNCSYLLELDNLLTGKTFAGDDHFIATYKVVETNSPEHKPGDEVSYYCAAYGPAKPNFLGNVKKVLVALCGTMAQSTVDPAQIGEEEYDELMKPKADGALPGTAAQGVRVTAKTKGIKTKKGADFTVVDFYPVIRA